MREITPPKLHYHFHEEATADHQRNIDKAFDILFEEVLRSLSDDSTHRNGQDKIT